jgi:hypothetical protein
VGPLSKRVRISIIISVFIDNAQMIHLHKSSSHSGLEGGNHQHYGSITDSEIMRGGIQLSTAGHEELSEGGGADSEIQKGRSAIRA